MAELVTYKDIARKFDVGVQTARKWGNAGDLGPKVIEVPAHFKKGLAFKGAAVAKVRDGRMKLTDDGVRQMRKRGEAGESLDDLAAAFGVHESYVSLILRNKRRVSAGV
jgi:hypothetical protein